MRKPTKIPRRNTRPVSRKSKARKVHGNTLWDQAARWYDSLVSEQGSDYQKDIILPGAFDLLDPKKGAKVLDLACGQGVFSRYLARRGIQVEGLDSSKELIHYARSRSKANITYHVADAADPNALEGKKFDGIACLLALQNMEQIEPVFHNVKRWLKPGGRFILVITHPCFRIPRQTHWDWDEEKKQVYRRVDLYASEVNIPILTPPMASSKIFTVTYHRPLQYYFRCFANAGLAVDLLEEWTSKKVSQPGKRSRAENRARKEIPLFMAMRVVPVLS